jgi:hypothetical protein
MEAIDILYVIFSGFILAFPLYEKMVIKEEIRSKVLYYVYAPLAFVCLILMVWSTISSNIEKRKFVKRLAIQEKSTLSLEEENLKISSFEISTNYQFKYKDKLRFKFSMDKRNPIKTSVVNTDEAHDSITFTCDDPKVFYPDEHTIEFKFYFKPDSPSDIYGKPLSYLSKYDKIYFPWKSFTHYLALTKVGGPIEKSDFPPTLDFKVMINGRVLLDQTEEIKNIDPKSVVLIFPSQSHLFIEIEKWYLDL